MSEINIPRRTEIDEVLLIEAVQLCISTQFGSTSMLQRKLNIGFSLARKVMERFVELGIIEKQNDSGWHDVLFATEQESAAVELIKNSFKGTSRNPWEEVKDIKISKAEAHAFVVALRNLSGKKPARIILTSEARSIDELADRIESEWNLNNS